MAGTSFQTVDEYIASKETISYNIPAYKVNGRAALYFAGWKRFYSIYPASNILERFGDELAGADIVKSTIRFPFSNPAPVKLIAKIARFRVNEISRL